jgi:hypothetical protein
MFARSPPSKSGASIVPQNVYINLAEPPPPEKQPSSHNLQSFSKLLIQPLALSPQQLFKMASRFLAVLALAIFPTLSIAAAIPEAIAPAIVPGADSMFILETPSLPFEFGN